jgi:hypothetical protein
MRQALLASIVSPLLGLCGCQVADWLGIGEAERPLHDGLPQVMTFGGPVLTMPKVVPIFFDGDSMVEDVEGFLTKLRKSSYWESATREYGVGRLRIEPSIVIPETAPTSSNADAVEALIREHLDGTHADWPVNDGQTMYVVFFPLATVLSHQGGFRCTEFGGFHGEASGSGTRASSLDGGPSTDGGGGSAFVYAAVAECDGFDGLTGFDTVTATLSRELVEAATDPLDSSDPAYRIVDRDHLAWLTFFDGTNTRLASGEVVGLCQQEEWTSTRRRGRLEDGTIVSRSWSNARATAGLDPCVPPSATYFNAAPDLTETLGTTIARDYQNIGRGLNLPVHASKTVDVRLFSAGVVDDWHVDAETDVVDEKREPVLRFSWDRATGNDGTFLRLTLTRLHRGPVDGTPFWIRSSSKPGGAGELHRWAGLVGN